MVDTVRVSKFLPYVIPHAPGCPTFTAESAVRLAAIEFCEKARCWRHLDQIEIDDENTVALVAPDYAAIHEIEFASFSNESTPRQPLTPTQYSDIGERYRASLEDVDGAPRYITQVNPNSVTLFPFTAGTLEVSLFLKPRMGQSFVASTADDPIQDEYDQVPAFLLTQWGEAIADGALSKLLLQPQTQWYDPNRAQYYMGRFMRACDSKFAQSLRGQHRAPKRTRFRFL